MSLDQVIALVEEAKAAGENTAVALYRQWIEQNSESPQLAVAWFNLGVEASSCNDDETAAYAYRNCITIEKGLYQAYHNLGLLHERAGRSQDAIKVWHEALQPDEARVSLLNQNARLLEKLGELAAAELTLTASISTQPDQPDAIQHWVHLRQRMCLWPILSNLFGFREDKLLSYSGALAALAITDQVSLQSQITSDWIARKTSPAPFRASPADGYTHDRIRLGYISSDFGRHAMGYLIADLFSHHSRESFCVYGYCIGRDDGSPLRRRIEASFDAFSSLRDLSDEEAAFKIASDEIDILIDLNGLTLGARPQILRWRPAPVQATYLGYIGPVPIPELDYLLCDSYVVPEETASSYFPKPLYIGSIYQANDSARDIAAEVTRSEVGLPSDAFIYCNFSNHYKVTQSMFLSWMEILRRVSNSVLWLAEDNRWSKQNLLIEAEAAGISQNRLIFMKRVDPASYMSRFSLADIYLDTFPYNSGTVASDALRMGLPLVTMQGKSFASRMASRLLHAMDAHLGIAENIAAYVETAVLLGTRPDIYKHFRATVGSNKWQQTIGDITTFTNSLEETLRSIALRPTPS